MRGMAHGLVDSLWKAIQGLPNEAELLAEGGEALAIHPKLQRQQEHTLPPIASWWYPMKFLLMEPTKGIVKNAPMTEEQVELLACCHIHLYKCKPTAPSLPFPSLANQGNGTSLQI